MKTILVEDKRKEPEPKKEKPTVIVQKFIKQVAPQKRTTDPTLRERQTIAIFAIWTVAMWTFFLRYQSEANGWEFLFYWGLLMGLAYNNLQYLKRKEALALKKDLSLDVGEALPTFAVWGFIIFAFSTIMFGTAGASMRFPTTYEILRTCILVVPAETYIFIVFLPRILDVGISSKIPWIPGALYAQILFGLMHWVSGSLSFGMSLIAVMMGLLWYTMYKAGDIPTWGKLLGLPSVLAFHAAWNLVAISSSSIAGDPLILLFKMMGIG